MRIISDNWRDDIEFDSISFVHFKPGKNYSGYKRTVIASVSKEAGAFKLAMFFRYVASLVSSAKHRKVYRNQDDEGHFQFELANEQYPDFPVKWFTLHLDNGIKIKYDIAFNTTFIYKNGIRVYFTGRKKKNHKYSKYLELNMAKRAYIYIANQFLK